MEFTSMAQFMERTMGGRHNQMDMSPYVGQPFDCGCGDSHTCDPYSVPILRELPHMCFVLGCPNDLALTCVRACGLLTFTGFESLFAVRFDKDDVAPSNDVLESMFRAMTAQAGGSAHLAPPPRVLADAQLRRVHKAARRLAFLCDQLQKGATTRQRIERVLESWVVPWARAYGDDDAIAMQTEMHRRATAFISQGRTGPPLGTIIWGCVVLAGVALLLGWLFS